MHASTIGTPVLPDFQARQRAAAALDDDGDCHRAAADWTSRELEKLRECEEEEEASTLGECHAMW
jgi:hypothetical protein